MNLNIIKNIKLLSFILIFLTMIAISPMAFADLTTDLVAYYKLDETSGSTAYTSIGDYNLTHFSTPTINQTGKINKSVLYSASSSQYSKVDSNMNWNGYTNRTISGWIYLTSLPANNTCYDLFSLSNGSNGRALHMSYCNTSETYILTGAVDRVMQSQYGSVITITLDVNTWYFTSVVFNNNNVQLFLNNTNGTNTSVSTSNGSKSNDSFRIATRYDNIRYSNARIDEVGIWSRALSSTEITDLYKSGIGFSYPFEIKTVTPSSTTGTYNNNLSITLTTNQNGSTGIFYTTDGTDPDNTDTEYTGAITISGTTTLKAVSYDGTNYSKVMSETYTMEVFGNPTADKNAGVYYAPINVALTKAGTTTGTTLTYTTDGTDPTIASTEYTTPITIAINNDQNTTLKFAEFKTGYTSSAIQTLEFDIRDANLHIYFYDENTLAKLDGNVSIVDLTNNQTYYADENGLFSRYLTDIDWKEKQINAYVERKVNGVTTHTSKNLQFYWKNQDYNLNFALLPVGLGENIEFLVKDTNNELWTNKYIKVLSDTNTISINKTSSEGLFKSYLLQDFNYNFELYNELGVLQDDGNLIKRAITLTFSEDVNAIILNSPILFTNTSNIEIISSTLINYENYRFRFNQDPNTNQYYQFFEFIGSTSLTEDRNFQVYDINFSDETELANYCYLEINVKEMHMSVENAVVELHLIDKNTGEYKLYGERLTNQYGTTYFYIPKTENPKFIVNKTGFEEFVWLENPITLNCANNEPIVINLKSEVTKPIFDYTSFWITKNEMNSTWGINFWTLVTNKDENACFIYDPENQHTITDNIKFNFKIAEVNDTDELKMEIYLNGVLLKTEFGSIQITSINTITENDNYIIKTYINNELYNEYCVVYKDFEDYPTLGNEEVTSPKEIEKTIKTFRNDKSMGFFLVLIIFILTSIIGILTGKGMFAFLVLIVISLSLHNAFIWAGIVGIITIFGLIMKQGVNK